MSEVTSTDIIIIGGGIVGTAIARELSKYKLDIVLLEKEPDIAMGTTKANSAILHAGFDAHPGTLKAKLNVRGNALYHQLQTELDLDIHWLGSLVVATNETEQKIIADLLERGYMNGVPDLKILTRAEALAREPNLSPNVISALWAPSAGVFLPFGAALAFAETALQNGVKILMEHPVTAIATEKSKITGVHTPFGFIAAKYIINAAGVTADDIAQLAGDQSFTITPRKGEYILFDQSVSQLVKTIVFPTPQQGSKGILVSPTVHGNMFIGPNAADIDDKNDLATTPNGMQQIISGAQRLFPNLPLNASITQFSGLRAVADSADGDFIIRPSANIKGLIHAAGIQSPGLTSAPAIAELICEILRDDGLLLQEKSHYKASYQRNVVFRELSERQQRELLSKNPLYGRVICRCETITEGEILAAIHSPCGAKTVDAVKRRTRAGMGRCQGGFCGPKVTKILARELHVPIPSIRKDQVGSFLFFDKIQGNCEVTDVD